MGQKRHLTLWANKAKLKLTCRILTLTPRPIKQVRVIPTALYLQGSQALCGTFQTKSAENWDEELTQSAHLRNPRLALYATVGYTFLYLVLISRKVATKTIDL